MDPSSQDPKSALKIDPNQDLAHITAEIYKKNMELLYSNKTLSILRKVDEIILSSVTDPVQVAQQVANTVVPVVEYKLLSIFLLDKANGVLFPLAISQTEAVRATEKQLNKNLINMKISTNDPKNLISEAVRTKMPQVTNLSYDIYSPYLEMEEATTLQNTIGIFSFVVYPLVIRADVMGVIIISLAEEVKAISVSDRDLMDRLSQVIGIAIDNALLYEKIQDANEKLKQLDHLKDEFVSLASHELRTPLTAIKSYLWMALEGKGGPITEKQKYYLDRSYKSADRLATLVNDMLDVSRIESGRIQLDKKEVGLPAVVEDVIAEVLPHAQEVGVKLSYEKALNIPDVLADVDKIKEVLINLIGNSLKFTPKGGEIKITFSFNEATHMVTTLVHDTGKGIAPENISKLFQKFGILEGTYSASESSHGTGLGLYITRSIVELHGGQMSVSSDGLGKGATFSFTLPMYVAAAPVTPPAQPTQTA